MYKLFTDKPETFECDIKIEGASLSNSKARLVVETKDYSLLFNGKINSSGKCSIPIKKLKGLIDESSKGDIRLEVIAEDTYFTPWESKFEIEASKKVTVEVKSQTSNKNILKEKVQVKNIKQEVTQKETNHVVNIMKLLIREDISIENLSIKKDRLNKVIATYCKYKPILENKKSEVIQGVLKELHKK
tara:strand:+ start:82 stop:645 length:564 start_codon:yes stop_codon:yes gene_type:complete